MGDAREDELTKDRTAEEPGRRSFFGSLFKSVIALWGLGFFGVVLSYIKPPTGRRAESNVKRAGSLAQLEVGGATLVQDPRQPFWVIRPSKDQLIALTATCTHLRCVLQWNKEQGRLVCPCHAGAFDLNGNVVDGPPPRPLRSLPINTRGDTIYVKLS